MKKRVAILISGRGSNMVSLAEACRTPGYPAEVALVLSNRPDAAGLERARAAGLRTLVIDHKPFASRDAFDDAVDRALADAGAEIVCHAGFMRIQGDAFARRWLGRQLNIHPSLLPSFKGLHPHKQALDAGVRISGCTVHFVTPDLDSGPIVAQAAVPVLPGDDVAALEARILSAEHTLYPLALKLVATGEITMAGIAATPASPVNQQAPLFSPAP
ncbi:MAG: phosphoribosylglycinamide formyltransferase [Hyphomicrobiaceae bacterium]